MHKEVFYDSNLMQNDAQAILLMVESPTGRVKDFVSHQALLLHRITALVQESMHELKENTREMVQQYLGYPVYGVTPREMAMDILQHPAYLTVLSDLQGRYQDYLEIQTVVSQARGKEEADSVRGAGSSNRFLSEEHKKALNMFHENTLRDILEQLSMQNEDEA